MTREISMNNIIGMYVCIYAWSKYVCVSVCVYPTCVNVCVCPMKDVPGLQRSSFIIHSINSKHLEVLSCNNVEQQIEDNIEQIESMQNNI